MEVIAKVKGNLISNLGEVFEGSLVYIDNSGNIYPLSDTPVLVYTVSGNDGSQKTTIVKWNDDEGILLKIDGKIIVNREYVFYIIWSIE